MSGADTDLGQFLEVLTKLMGRHVVPGEPLGTPDRADRLEQALAEADVLGLAGETYEMENALRWLAEVVRTLAHHTPSIALVLAARYTAHRALRSVGGEGDSASAAGATAGLVAHLDIDDPTSVDAARSTVPCQFDPEVTLLLDAGGAGGVFVGRDSTAVTSSKRTGLRDARLCTVRVVGPPIRTLRPAAATAAVSDLAVLTASASLGVAEAAVSASGRYAFERRQFGSNLLSFAGIRAMLVEMQLRVSAVSALLDRALDDGTVTSCVELSATAGRVAVDVALDAIQVHGGYGYIDEYPVAGLLRDALSLRARNVSRRSSVSRLAVERFGPVG